MQEQVLEFIKALRRAGVRISIPESVDALHALEQAGIAERAVVRAALQATLVKQQSDLPAFWHLFPAYFGGSGIAFVQPGNGERLTPTDQAMLDQALRDVAAQVDAPDLAMLFEAIVGGRQLSQDQLENLLDQLAPIGTGNPLFLSWMTRRTLRDLRYDQLARLIEDLLAALRGAGMREETLQEIAESIRANQAAQAEQIGHAVRRQMLRYVRPTPVATRPIDELFDRPFHLLSPVEIAELRAEVARLAARLRTQAALRRRRARRGVLDPRATIRASLRFGGVPFGLRRRRRRLKPRLIVLCDVSSSMRAVSSFMLLLVYALHDQVGRTRSFAYIDDLYDISTEFTEARPAQAIAAILERIRADYARTNLGVCLEQFVRNQLGNVDRRTTVIILGDGRNNRSDPGLDELRQIKARARRLIWFNPEARRDWGSGDSDMPAYAPLCDAVHVVRNLRQLSAAIESLLRDAI